MIDTTLFPVSEAFQDSYKPNQLGHILRQGFGKNKDLDSLDIAIIGLGDKNPLGANEVRKQLYKYYWHFGNLQIADLGDFVFSDHSEQETHQLAELLKLLKSHQVTVILFGGSSRSWYASYSAFEMTGKPLNLVSIDRGIDWDETYEDHGLNRVLHEDTFLSQYSHFGYQSYFTDPLAIAEMQKRHFLLTRLGVAKNDLKESEPMLRNAGVFNFNANSIQSSYIKSGDPDSPNGFSGAEACAISRYAGMGPELSFFNLCNFRADDIGSVQNIAQIMWYFFDGFEFRVQEDPLIESKRFLKYITDIDTQTKYHLVFYKSRDTEKWWMHIPVESPQNYLRSAYLIPCSYNDYQTAQNGEIPDRWLQAVSRIEG